MHSVKKTRSSFKQHVEKIIKREIESSNLDVYEPIHTNSLGGSKYFVSFIDDCIRKMLIYLIKKNEVFKNFNFKAMVERQSEEYIKVLRADEGGKCVSQKFN